MPQHTPGDSQISVVEAAAAQPPPLALLENRNARLSRTTPPLQPDETLFAQALPHGLWVPRTDRVVDLALREFGRALPGAKSAIRTGGGNGGRQVEVGLSLDALGQLPPLGRRLLAVEFPIKDQPLG